MAHIVTLANSLQAAGHRVDLVCLETATESIGLNQGISFTGLAIDQTFGLRKLSHKLNGGLRLRNYLAKKSFDVLYVIDSWTLPSLWIATAGKLRWPRARLVYHTFDWLEPSLTAKVHCWLERQVCRRADLVVNTDRARARLQRTLYGLKRTPLWVQNCLPGNIVVQPPQEQVRRELAGAKENANLRLIIYPTIVSDARSAQRMTWELIQALRELPERYRLIVFFRDGVEYQRCQDACTEAGLTERVKFLRPVPLNRLLGYIASADLGAIFYDDAESSGYFMCNADKLSLLTACGVPFVASDQPNLESLVYRYGLGMCCDPRDAKALAKAFQDIAEGTISLPIWKERVRNAFLKHLNFEIHSKRLIKALDQLEAT